MVYFMMFLSVLNSIFSKANKRCRDSQLVPKRSLIHLNSFALCPDLQADCILHCPDSQVMSFVPGTRIEQGRESSRWMLSFQKCKQMAHTRGPAHLSWKDRPSQRKEWFKENFSRPWAMMAAPGGGVGRCHQLDAGYPAMSRTRQHAYFLCFPDVYPEIHYIITRCISLIIDAHLFAPLSPVSTFFLLSFVPFFSLLFLLLLIPSAFYHIFGFCVF